MTRAHAREAGSRTWAVSPDEPDRQAAGFHKLRQGRDQCTATRRDGQPCQAPAIEGALVCRRHGGGAPQVAIKAAHVRLQMAAYTANAEWQEARGTPREFDALCKTLQANRALDAFEVKLRLVCELRAEVRQKHAAERDPDAS